MRFNLVAKREASFQRRKDKEYRKKEKFGLILAGDRLKAKVANKQHNNKLSHSQSPEDKGSNYMLPGQSSNTVSSRAALQMMPTVLSTSLPASKSSGIWLFFVMLILVLRQNNTMVAAASPANEFGRGKNEDAFATAPIANSFFSDSYSAELLQQRATLFSPVLAQPAPPQTNNLASIDLFSSTMTTCFPITPEVIADFCIGETSAENLEKITSTIVEVITIDPAIAEYISVVFNFLPDFKIALVSLDELNKFKPEEKLYVTDKIGGRYDPNDHTLYLSNLANKAGYAPGLILHEFRHAFMHTIQIARAPGSLVMSVENYYPLTAQEGAKVMRLIEKGNAKIHHLMNLLVRENNNNVLFAKEISYLMRLRRLISSNSHFRHYIKEGEHEVDRKNFEVLYKDKIGHVVHSQSGPLKVKGYKKISSDRFTINSEAADPLWNLYQAYATVLNQLKNYPQTAYLYEMDAYLFQYIPVPYLQEFFPEYLNYTKQLIATIQFPARVSTDVTRPYSFMYPFDLEAEQLLTQAEISFKPSDAQEMLRVMDIYIPRNTKLDQCEKGAQLLIKKGVNVGKANLALGEIYHLRGAHDIAEQYYAMAIQRKTALRPDQALHYAETLMANKKYKEVEDVCRLSLSSDPEDLDWTLEKFEQLARVAKEKQDNPAPWYKPF